MKSKSLELARLRGILSGISTDSKINENELLFLDAWLRERDRELGGEGDVVDLLEQIADVLEDGIITQDEMHDTLNMIDCILEFQENPPHTSDLQEVFGFVQGTVSDQVVTGEELNAIRELLEQNDDVPMCALLSLKIRSDIDPNSLLEVLKSFSGHYLEETGTTQDWASYLGDRLPGEYDFKGKKVCFTGGVTGMPRSTLKSHLSKLGGSVTKSVSRNTDVLVVGDECSRGWIEHNYGTKLEAACKLKLKGQELLIVSGDEWVSKTANQKDPKSEQRRAVWSKFGDHQDLDSLYQATMALCVEVNLTASQYSDPDYDSTGISVHRRWNNGNALKKRELFIEFVPSYYGNSEDCRTRPWVVGSDETQSTAYQKQSSAFDKFRTELSTLVANRDNS